MFGGDTARLSHTDAKFVDVIHTDGGVFGYPWALGHADFFPNGGTPLQPGCVQEESSKNRWLGIIRTCIHLSLIALFYFFFTFDINQTNDVQKLMYLHMFYSNFWLLFYFLFSGV